MLKKICSAAFISTMLLVQTCQPSPANRTATSPEIYHATYPYTLPALPYRYSDLKPYIDKKTMKIHHTKHHQAYINNLNKALEQNAELHHKTLFELLSTPEQLPADVRTAIEHQGGGHFNHSLFWTMMGPCKIKKPSGELARHINTQFGSFGQFKKEFTKKAKAAFGSGWVWLVTDAKGNLSIITSHDQEVAISGGLHPILGLDVWEHAYYLKYQNRRPDYISAWWHIVNWPQVESYYAAATKQLR